MILFLCSLKRLTHSRAYIDFNKPDDVFEFAEFFDGHVFVNEKGDVPVCSEVFSQYLFFMTNIALLWSIRSGLYLFQLISIIRSSFFIWFYCLVKRLGFDWGPTILLTWYTHTHTLFLSGTQFKANVEYAPSQRVPKQWSKKDGRDGTILKGNNSSLIACAKMPLLACTCCWCPWSLADPEYLEFLELISKPVENLPSAEIQLERKEAERAG